MARYDRVDTRKGEDTLLYKMLSTFGPRKGGMFDFDTAKKKHQEVYDAAIGSARINKSSVRTPSMQLPRFYSGFGEGTRYRDSQPRKEKTVRVVTIQEPVYAVEAPVDELLSAYPSLTEEQRGLIFPVLQSAASVNDIAQVRCVNETQAHGLLSILLRHAKEWTVKVRSLTDYYIMYDVKGRGKVATSCSCPNFTKGGNPNCKHMRMVTSNPTYYGLPSV